MPGYESLTHALEALLTRESILKSPALSSLIVLRNQIPVAHLCDLACLRPFHPSASAVWAACSSSARLHGLLSQWPSLTLPFSVDPLALQLRECPRPLPAGTLSRYISVISGTGRYRIVRPNRACPARIQFEAAADLFAVWRAFAYCPLDGFFLKAEMGVAR